MECAPIRAQAWLDEHEGDLVDLGVEDAAALIERAGLHARVVAYPSGWMTQEQRRDRINVWLDAGGDVSGITAG